jgi:hypothetical protein
MPVFSQKDDDDYNKHKSILFNLCKAHICLSSSQLLYSSWWLCYCFCIMAGNTRMRTQPPARRSAKAVPKCAIFNPRTFQELQSRNVDPALFLAGAGMLAVVANLTISCMP